MSKTFFTSDSHFHHSNILKFTNNDGKLIRPGFSSGEEQNEYMVAQWNEVVGPEDKVYHLGDVVMSTGAWAFEILERLNGRKVLIKGNHDRAKLSIYARHFSDVRSEIHMKLQDGRKVIFTHRPILLGETEFNVHGHIHEKEIDDSRYLNVSVERWDYTPIEWGDVQKQLLMQSESFAASTKSFVVL